MDKKNDLNIPNKPNQQEKEFHTEKDYRELSKVLNYQGNFLKDTQAKIAEISGYLKKFKILEDPQYYNTNKEYAQLMKSTKLRLEKLIFQTLFYSDSTLRIEDFKIKK